ncbi:ribonuclease P [Candidatus Woesearchaeota archaeon]|nr:ribonuclease P [Candidatus Woesearchaeota archaeon]
MKKLSKREALDQIVHLFDDAETVAGEDLSLANKLIKKARRIAMKVRVSIPIPFKRRFCKHCGIFFIPGKTYRVRTKDKKIIYTCLVCKRFMRFPTKKLNS